MRPESWATPIWALHAIPKYNQQCPQKRVTARFDDGREGNTGKKMNRRERPDVLVLVI